MLGLMPWTGLHLGQTHLAVVWMTDGSGARLEAGRLGGSCKSGSLGMCVEFLKCIVPLKFQFVGREGLVA